MQTTNNMLPNNRKSTESIMQQADLRLLPLIMNNVPQALSWKGPDLVYLGCNRAFAKRAGYSSPEDVIGKTDFDMPWKDQAEVYRAEDRGMLQSGESKLNYEQCQTASDGSILWLRANKILVQESGETVAILAMYEDVTERKYAEEAIRNNEEKLRAIYEGTNDAVMLLNEKGFFDCNPHTLKMFGFKTKEEFTAVHPSDVSPQFQQDGRDSRLASQEHIKTAYRDGVDRFEWVHHRTNGEDFPAEVLLSALDFGGQRVLQATVRDIAERKLTEQKLNESEERYRRLSEASVEGVVIHDKGILLDMNEVFATMFGYELSEVIGMSAMDFLTPETREITAQNIRSGYEKPYEAMGLRKDGSTFPVEISGKSIPYEGRMVRVTALRDITERKKAEEAVRSSQEQLLNIIEFLPDAAFVTDKERKVIAWNRAVEEMTGIKKEEIIGKGDFAYAMAFYGEARPMLVDFAMEHRQVSDRYGTVQRQGDRISAETYAPAIYEGQGGYVLVNASPLYDAEGTIVGAIETVRDITERKRLEQEVQTAFERRGRQVQISTQVAQSIAAATSLEDLYQRVVTQVKEQFGYYHTQLLRYDSALDAVVLVTGYGATGEKMLAAGHRLPMGKGLIGTAANTGETVLRPTLENDLDWRPHPLLPDTKGEIAVPIKLGEKILGVLDVQSNVAGTLNADDQLLLEGLCGQIAVAIESTRLSQEMADRLKEINRLYQAMSREGWQSYWQTTDIPLGFMYDQGGLREVKETTLAQESFTDIPIAVPGGEVIGKLAIADDPEYPMSAEDKDFIQQVSEQVALALESARLFEQTQSALASTQDSESKLSEALGIAKEALDIAKLSHWEYDVEKDLFTFNDSFYSIFHTTAEEAGGYQISSARYAELFVHPDDAAVVGNEIGRALASTDRHYSTKLEHRILFRDGGVGYIAVEIHIERDENGKITRYYGANQDITERRTAQEAIAKRARDLAAVSEISSASTKELDVQKMLETVVHLTQRQFGLYHCHVFLYNEQTNLLKIAACGWKEEDVQEGTHDAAVIPLDQEQSLVARAARTQKPIIVNDVQNEPGWLPNPFLPDTAAELAVPLLIGGRLLGVLDVQSERLNAFTDEDANIQTTLAAQVATALQNAHSFNQAQSALTQSEKLYDASRRLTQATDLQNLVAETVAAMNITEVNRALLASFDYDQNGDVEQLTIIGNWWNSRGHAITPVGTRYPREVIRVMSMFVSPTPVFFNDTFTDERVDATTMQLVERLNLRAVAVLPLHLGTQQIGALILEAEDPHNFTQDEIRLFSALAPQIATVVENKRQFEKAQRQAERESMLNAIGQKIQSATSVEAVLQIAARELGRALSAPLTVAQLGMSTKTAGNNGN